MVEGGGDACPANLFNKGGQDYLGERLARDSRRTDAIHGDLRALQRLRFAHVMGPTRWCQVAKETS